MEMEIEINLLRERRADPQTQLGIDESILEYLVYKATKVLLRDFSKSGSSQHVVAGEEHAGLHLDLVDAFLVMFHDLHPDYHGSPELQLRLRLLRFTTLFIRRQSMIVVEPWSTKLQGMRSRRREAANVFQSGLAISKPKAHIGPPKDLENVDLAHLIDYKALETFQQRKKLSLPSMSLLDTLPSFMALSAAENAMQQSRITATWMRLAAGYMAQAVLEQYLVYGSQRNSVLEEAFAWGFNPNMVADESSDDWLINAMFLDEDAEFKEWREIQDEHLRALIPSGDYDLTDHLKSLREHELSLAAFEHCINQFLQGVMHSLSVPLLLQMESSLGNTQELQGDYGVTQAIAT